MMRILARRGQLKSLNWFLRQRTIPGELTKRMIDGGLQGLVSRMTKPVSHSCQVGLVHAYTTL